MDAKYKNGKPLPVQEVTGLMIALLFAGQHTSSVTSTWTGLYILHNKERLMPRLLDEVPPRARAPRSRRARRCRGRNAATAAVRPKVGTLRPNIGGRRLSTARHSCAPWRAGCGARRRARGCGRSARRR